VALARPPPSHDLQSVPGPGVDHGGVHAGQRPEPEPAGVFRRRQQQGGGSVGDLRGVPRGDLTRRVEGWLEAGQGPAARCRGAGPRRRARRRLRWSRPRTPPGRSRPLVLHGTPSPGGRRRARAARGCAARPWSPAP